MLKDILSISGQSGLFKMISKGNNNVIVESLANGNRFPAFSTNKIISLNDIAMFTESGELPLNDVFRRIAAKENSQKTIDAKSSSDDLKKFFREIVPDYDASRVYVSDMKKVIQWYNILVEKDMLHFEDPEETKEETKEEQTEE